MSCRQPTSATWLQSFRHCSIRSCLYTRLHARPRARMCARPRARMPTRPHKRTPARLSARPPARKQEHPLARTHVRRSPCTRWHAHSHKHVSTHARTHERTHAARPPARPAGRPPARPPAPMHVRTYARTHTGVEALTVLQHCDACGCPAAGGIMRTSTQTCTGTLVQQVCNDIVAAGGRFLNGEMLFGMVCHYNCFTLAWHAITFHSSHDAPPFKRVKEKAPRGLEVLFGMCVRDIIYEYLHTSTSVYQCLLLTLSKTSVPKLQCKAILPQRAMPHGNTTQFSSCLDNVENFCYKINPMKLFVGLKLTLEPSTVIRHHS